MAAGKGSTDQDERVSALARVHGVFNLLVGVVLLGIGLSGFLLVGWGSLNAHDPLDGTVLTALGVGAAISTGFLVGGAKAIRFTIRAFRPGGVDVAEISPLAAEIQRGRLVHRSAGPLSSGLVLAHAFCLLFGAFLASVFVFILSRHPEDWPVALFPAALSLAFLAFSGRRLLHQRKFGASTCHPKTRPPFAEGALEAEVEIAFRGTATVTPAFPAGPVRAELRLMKGNGRHFVAFWKSKSSIPAEAVRRPGDGTLRVPVRIAVADQARKLVEQGAYWELRLRAPYPGIDYASDFVLPAGVA